MDSKRVLVTVLIFSVIAIFALSLVMAVKLPKGWKMDAEKASFGDNNSSNDSVENQTTNENHGNHHNKSNETKNMTYGRCVSNETKIRNVCYLAAKVKRFECVLAVKNQTDLNKTQIKESVVQCKAAYKAEKELCKVDFKTSKEECKQYKKNYLQRLID